MLATVCLRWRWLPMGHYLPIIMNNEPVAWMDDFGNVFEMKNQFFHIPLYTHPAKTLTDDEIRILINEVPDYNIDIHDLMEFARAILRKAQENG